MQPWMSKEEINLIEKYLKNTHIALEWGSGGSTAHFSKLVKEWNSLEHNKEWYQKVLKSKPNMVYLLNGLKMKILEYMLIILVN